MEFGLLASAFALGASLGLLPGPVQFVLLTESTRGGIRQGFAAMAGANGTFGVEVLALSVGLAALSPTHAALRILQAVGGLFLLALASDALRSAVRPVPPDTGRLQPRRTPVLKGILAVLLNPGAWVFLATAASALFATAISAGGRPLSLASALALLAGVAAVDGSMVLLGGSIQRFNVNVARWLAPLLACGLAAFGIVLLIQGIRG